MKNTPNDSLASKNQEQVELAIFSAFTQMITGDHTRFPINS